jgi:hypothetical protein
VVINRARGSRLLIGDGYLIVADRQFSKNKLFLGGSSLRGCGRARLGRSAGPRGCRFTGYRLRSFRIAPYRCKISNSLLVLDELNAGPLQLKGIDLHGLLQEGK